MPGFLRASLLDLVAQGENLSLLERAVLLYGNAVPDSGPADVWDLPIGDRDRAIWQVWRQDQRAALEALSACPECGEAVEFTLPDDFAPPAALAAKAELTLDGRKLTLRMPTSRDLRAAQQGAFTLRDLVVEGDKAPELSEETIEAALEATDPGLDVVIAHGCPACGVKWKQSFDVIRFVWQDCLLRAERLLRDIDIIARAYAWSEADILALSEARRSRYVSLTREQAARSASQLRPSEHGLS